MIKLPKNVSREVDDIILTRYACFLIVQNGDMKPSLLIINTQEDY